LCAGAGWPVTVFDSDAKVVERALHEVPRRARALVALEHATQGIVERGLLEFHQGRSLLQTVQDADWIIEAISEDLPAKQRLVESIELVAGPEALLTSSSSGLFPDDVFARSRRQDRCLVAHPLNPPELLPLVELVPGPQLTCHRGAGAGGVPLFLQRLLTTFEAWWSNLATWQKLEPEQQRGLIQTIEKAYGEKVEMLRAARDRRLSAILRALEQSRTT